MSNSSNFYALKRAISNLGIHSSLIAYSILVIFPLYVMIVNSLKTNREIFRDPFGLPNQVNFSGYIKVWSLARFDIFFKNSLVVTLTSILLILVVSSLASYALAKYRFRGSSLIYVYFLGGIMIPIRLGTINIFQIIKTLGLYDNLLGLILIYIAMGIPLSIFILTEFIRLLPEELSDAARIDGCSEFKIFYRIVLPLLRPPLATVAMFNLIPIWNDLWFPLIFIKSENLKTVPLAVSIFFGQYQTDWVLMLSSLSLAALPVIVLYLIMSKQFIRGLTAGAIK